MKRVLKQVSTRSVRIVFNFFRLQNLTEITEQLKCFQSGLLNFQIIKFIYSKFLKVLHLQRKMSFGPLGEAAKVNRCLFHCLFVIVKAY